MKVTKRQLKQIILESMSSTPLDIVDGDTGEIYADWEKPEWNDEQFNGMEADFEIWLSRKKNKDFIRHPDSEELTREYGPGWYVRNKWQDLKADQRAADRKLVGKYNLPADGWGIPEGKMKITKRQLRRIIRESLPYRKGQPWVDPKAPVGVDRTEDDLDRELTDEEIETAEGWEPADPAGDSDFWAGYGDAANGLGLPVGASPDYKAGWEDGSLDHVTESIIREVSGIQLSEGLQYHVDAGVGVDQNIYRPGSTAFFALFREARRLYLEGLYTPHIEEVELLDSDVGNFGMYEGRLVPLDYPIECGNEEHLNEAEYQGRKVELNKPIQGSPQAYVYVNSGKKDKDGKMKVKKVSFGSSMPDAMGDSDAAKKRRKSFGDRHNCADKDDKTAAGYWSCRATKFFGRDIAGWW